MPAPVSASPLDAGPPVPPGLRSSPVRSPQPSVEALAGSQPSTPAGGASIQQSVIEKLMTAEMALRSAAEIMPELAGVIDDITGRLRAQAGSVLVSSLQPQGAAQNPLMQLLTQAGVAQ